MPTKQIVSIPLLILSIFLFSQGSLAQETSPAEDNIVCDLLLEDTTDPLTSAIEAQQLALFDTGAAEFFFLVEAYGLLTDSMANLDRAAEFLVDMSVAECITQASSLDMVDKLHTARGKIGYARDNIEFVDAVVYSGLLNEAIALEEEVFQTLIGPPVIPGVPTVP